MSGVALQGSYCSYPSQQAACPSGSWCAEGVSQPAECVDGSYRPAELSEQAQCPAGQEGRGDRERGRRDPSHKVEESEVHNNKKNELTLVIVHTPPPHQSGGFHAGGVG